MLTTTKHPYFKRIKEDIDNRISECSPLQDPTNDEVKILWLVERIEKLEEHLEKTKKKYNNRMDAILKKLLEITNVMKGGDQS